MKAPWGSSRAATCWGSVACRDAAISGLCLDVMADVDERLSPILWLEPVADLRDVMSTGLSEVLSRAHHARLRGFG